MTTATSLNSSVLGTVGSSASSKTSANDPANMQDRFLKLLVAQMNNQDPMNPMDNAQMTTQMAQINTVSGIEAVNQTLKQISGQFSALQMLQGANLVGRGVLTEGSMMSVQDGVGSATFDLSGFAQNVQVEVTSAAGERLDVIQLGAQAAGRHAVQWDASQAQGMQPLGFRVVATNGDAAVAATPLTGGVVRSVSQTSDGLMLALADGRTLNNSSVVALQ